MEKIKKEDELLQSVLVLLERQRAWDGQPLVKYEGFWFPEMFIRSILTAQKHFKAKDSDIILATCPKAGTTWLKALVFSIANRNSYTVDQSPLLVCNPHELVPFIEQSVDDRLLLENISSPIRIFSSHVPFHVLPYSVRTESECRIVYICRNPLDQFISLHHFFTENKICQEMESKSKHKVRDPPQSLGQLL